jgi:uncharacterized repeat protein (TIGR03803 family)
MAASSARRFAAASLIIVAGVLGWSARAITQDAPLQFLHDFTYDPGHPAGGLTRGPDGTLYGTAASGPLLNGGAFSLTPRPDGSFQYRLLHAFTSNAPTDPRNPFPGLLLASDGHLYGTTMEGGADNAGTIFRVTTDGSFTTLFSFGPASGRTPLGRLMQAADGYIYGTTVAGGAFGLGTIFRISTAGAFTRIHSFWWFDGAAPLAGLMQAADGNFYGTAGSGGFYSAGTVFRMTTAGVVTPLHYFTTANGRLPAAGLIQASDGNLYGTTFEGGSMGEGTVFRITTGGAFTSLHSFPAGPGAPSRPAGGLVEATDGRLYGTVSGASANPGYSEGNHPGAIFRVGLNGGVELVHSFDIVHGMLPLGDLLETDNVFYGGTAWGGAEQHGMVFRFSAAEGLRTIHSFTGTVGHPEGLVLGSDGQFYGVDRSSGPAGTGAIFKVAPDGTYTPLRTLLASEGTTPSHLLQASDGYLYGTTRLGGAAGSGMVFRISHGGDLSVVASFGQFDGISGLPLVQAPDGMFYGSMEYGINSKGSVFRMTPAGEISTVYAFNDQFSSGIGAIILGRDGALYGTATFDGASQLGSVFRVTTDGAFTRLHLFTGGADGSRPVGRLVHAADGNVYGTTTQGGASNLGTVFRISPSGTLTTLHAFSGVDGAAPRHA